jgi:hypothetical protein
MRAATMMGRAEEIRTPEPQIRRLGSYAAEASRLSLQVCVILCSRRMGKSRRILLSTGTSRQNSTAVSSAKWSIRS